ncbi:MAG TPA: hypothetical protein VFQ23_15870, partial [Anaerolineales bacterium]|nr:hypothetical protein [Anaerolineales bacterium]
MNKSISRIVSVLFVLIFMLGLAGPAHAKKSLPVEYAKTDDAPFLLEFTSGGHALGFRSQGMYAATGTHALSVDFVGANPVSPIADTPPSTNGQASVLSKVSYANLWKGISLEYTATQGGVYMTTYELAPGAHVSDIRLGYNTSLNLDTGGALG